MVPPRRRIHSRIARLVLCRRSCGKPGERSTIGDSEESGTAVNGAVRAVQHVLFRARFTSDHGVEIAIECWKLAKRSIQSLLRRRHRGETRIQRAVQAEGSRRRTARAGAANRRGASAPVPATPPDTAPPAPAEAPLALRVCATAVSAAMAACRASSASRSGVSRAPAADRSPAAPGALPGVTASPPRVTASPLTAGCSRACGSARRRACSRAPAGRGRSGSGSPRA